MTGWFGSAASVIRKAKQRLLAVGLVAYLVVALAVPGWSPDTLDFDTEDVDVVEAAETRWARQNHSAAEGLGVPSDTERLSETFAYI